MKIAGDLDEVIEIGGGGDNRDQGEKEKVSRKRKCPQCGETVLRLDLHMQQLHRGGKEYKCELPCKYVTYKEANFIRHKDGITCYR